MRKYYYVRDAEKALLRCLSRSVMYVNVNGYRWCQLETLRSTSTLNPFAHTPTHSSNKKEGGGERGYSYYIYDLNSEKYLDSVKPAFKKRVCIEAASGFYVRTDWAHPKIPRPVLQRKIVLKNVKAKNFPVWAQLSSGWAEPNPVHPWCR